MLSAHPAVGERVRELVLLAGRGPLLRERELPPAAVLASDAEDVLHDPGFLVERLLDQKRVVLDLELAGWGRRLLRQRRSGNDEREEKKNRRDSHRPGLYAGPARLESGDFMGGLRASLSTPQSKGPYVRRLQ